jgi:hypothetical protein
LFFYKQSYPSTIDYEEDYGANGVGGGRLGFGSQSIITGYGVEFDGWANIAEEFDDIAGGHPNPPSDPSDSHIALIQDFAGRHLTYVNDQRVADNNWHRVSVEVQGSSVRVVVDQAIVLQWSGALNRTYAGFGFTGSNGACGNNWHIIDDFSITAHGLKQPALTVSCTNAQSRLGFNVQINGVLIFEGNGVADALIFLSYSVTGGKTWQDLTVVNTDADGSYSASWLTLVTGNYQVKATYEGDDNYLGTSSAVNFTVTQSATTPSEPSPSMTAASDAPATQQSNALKTGLPTSYGIAMVAVTVLLAALCTGLVSYVRKIRHLTE